MPTKKQPKATFETREIAAKLVEESAKIKYVHWPWEHAKLQITAIDERIRFSIRFASPIEMVKVARGAVVRCQVAVSANVCKQRSTREQLEFAVTELRYIYCAELQRAGYSGLAEKHRPKAGDYSLEWEDGSVS
jgi:hypothetical protein